MYPFVEGKTYRVCLVNGLQLTVRVVEIGHDVFVPRSLKEGWMRCTGNFPNQTTESLWLKIESIMWLEEVG